MRGEDGLGLKLRQRGRRRPWPWPSLFTSMTGKSGLDCTRQIYSWGVLIWISLKGFHFHTAHEKQPFRWRSYDAQK